jgi:peptidoglycan/LPS O-acetylase OafA/YrhL
MSQVKSFTGLRGLACIAVVLDHCASNNIGGGRSLAPAGGMAVLFFFVLSGFLLTKRGLGEIQPTKEDTPKRFLSPILIYYYLRRLFRIYPALLATFLLYYLIGVYTTANNYDLELAKYWRSQMWNTLFLQHIESHFWTIRIEVIFYLLMQPIVLVACSELMRLDFKLSNQHGYSRFYSLTFLACIIVTCIFITLQIKNDCTTDAFWLRRTEFILHFPTFWYGCLGGVISYYFEIYEIQPWIRKQIADKISLRIASECAIYLILLRIFFGNEVIAEMYFDLPIDRWYQKPPALTPFYVLILLLVEMAEKNNSFCKSIGAGFIYTAGEWSYTTYLIHYNLIQLYIMKSSLRGFEGTSGCVIIIYAISAVFYNVFEQVGVKIGNKVISRLKKINSTDQLMPKKSSHTGSKGVPNGIKYDNL